MHSSEHRVVRFTGSERSSVTDQVAIEEPLEFRLGRVPIAVLMRTPGMERELALGFALTEGILLSPGELEGVTKLDDSDRWELNLADGVVIDPEQFRRSVYTSSSCGVCGKASIDAVRIASRPIPQGPAFAADLIQHFVQQLSNAQPGFTTTGGLHGAAIFDSDGSLLASAEDIGRHNATDKAIGALATDRWPLGEVILQVSGRVSFEIAQKAAVAGIPVVSGVSAASSLAVALAEEVGMTLVGWARDTGFVAYTGAHRIS